MDIIVLAHMAVSANSDLCRYYFYRAKKLSSEDFVFCFFFELKNIELLKNSTQMTLGYSSSLTFEIVLVHNTY